MQEIQAKLQKEVVQLKAENTKLKQMQTQPLPSANLLMRKPSLNIPDRTFELKGPNNLGNFKDVLIKNQKLFEENGRLKNELQQIKRNKSEKVYKNMLNLIKQLDVHIFIKHYIYLSLKMLKIDLMEVKMTQQEDLVKFQDLWPHLFKIFEFQQQKLLKSEAKTLTLDKENKVLMFHMKSLIHH